MPVKNYNRGLLKRRIQKGELVAKCDHHYTDDYAHDNASNFGRTEWMPVRVVEHLGPDSFKEGWMSLAEWEFRTKSGLAYVDGEGVIGLKVHSNLHYSFKEK